MAIAYFYVRIVSRGSGHSAVLSAAYRHCAKMEYEREARMINYSNKPGLLHEEFLIPSDAPKWLRALVADRSIVGASEAFWNKVEAFEKRCDAQLAKDVTMALPTELSAEQHIALVRDFVQQHVLAKGMVADWVYHDVPGNPHVHLMMTIRPLTDDGFGRKRTVVCGPDGNPQRDEAGRTRYEHWVGGPSEFVAFREGWFACLNYHLALAGLDVRIDGRSYERQGIDLEPAIRLGVSAKVIEQRVEQSRSEKKIPPSKFKRFEIRKERRAENARRIDRRPEIVLDLISRERSIFDERDVATVLHRYLDDASEFRRMMARILSSPEALRLERERIEFSTGIRAPAKYTTRELIRLEVEMVNRAAWLASRSSYGVREEAQEATFARHMTLSAEQRAALTHVTGVGRIAAVVGRAGAGKTTMMRAARETWEAAGYRVVGGALAGKAAEGLEKEAGIRSSTLSSWERHWSEGRNALDDKTVFVLDEAGMVSSRQMALFVKSVTRAGAKLVLVGDPDQLQPIEAGAAFRTIAERIGYTELETIHRQREDWMRSASLALARGQVGGALSAYGAHDRLVSSELKAGAVECLIADWNRDYDPTREALILAHLRRDVRMLNEKARAKLVERGIVGEGLPFTTEEGVRHFAPGDQIVFMKNDRMLDVKNGMIGRVLEVSLNRIVAEVGEREYRRSVTVDSRSYPNVDLGYATTIHKSQGTTVDNVKMLASLSLDRHLAYVGMTRHREDLAIYYGQRSFENAGGLVSILSRSNAKESTLDYKNTSLYRQALRFAEVRGLHLMTVARTLVRDRLEWTVRQKQRLRDVVQRLATIGHRIRLTDPFTDKSQANVAEEKRPMVTGIKSFANSFEQAVDERLAADPGLKKQWEEVTCRFQLVYADPQTAFKAIDVDTMLKDKDVANATLAKIGGNPEIFGALNGKTGRLAWRAEKQDRERALVNAPALARNLERYLRLSGEAERKYQAEERTLRTKLAIDIPALSPYARQTLERARDAIGRSDAQSALQVVHADSQVRAELERFSKTVTERFGERTFLGIAASDVNGEVFDNVASGMTAIQKEDLRAAWSFLRTIQQVAAHERVSVALNQAETLRQTRSQGLSLK